MGLNGGSVFGQRGIPVVTRLVKVYRFSLAREDFVAIK